MASRDRDDWQPATAEPGELFTVEGRSRMIWAGLSGLKYRDDRGRRYRSSMLRACLWCLAAIALVTVLVAVL